MGNFIKTGHNEGITFFWSWHVHGVSHHGGRLLFTLVGKSAWEFTQVFLNLGFLDAAFPP